MGRSVGVALMAVGVAAGGCQTESFLGEDIAGVSAAIAVRDTTLLRGETATFTAIVQYVFGPGLPHAATWSVSDPAKLSVQVSTADRSVLVTARDTGRAYLRAFVNDKFRDSALIRIARAGDVRWRQALSGGAGTNAVAVDDSGFVYVIDGAVLRSYRHDGASRFTTATCESFRSPSVAAGAALYVTGTGCTRRHDAAGAVEWSAPLGNPEGGAAITAGDGAVVLATLGNGPGAVVVSRFSATGAEVWRDTLRALAVPQRSTPSIAFGGDIFVPWRAPADSNWLTRIAFTGTIRWTIPLPGWPQTGPAIDDDRVVVAYQGGLRAVDLAGATLWSVTFTAENPAAAADEPASSPVVDAAGNIYVQTRSGLHSYTSAGASRWMADSLGFGPTVDGAVGSPTILVNGTLVVPCRGEVCAVRLLNGSLAWRSSLGGGVVGTPGAGIGGTVLVTRQAPAELVGLWNRGLAATAGWATEGGDMYRSRRER